MKRKKKFNGKRQDIFKVCAFYIICGLRKKENRCLYCEDTHHMVKGEGRGQ